MRKHMQMCAFAVLLRHQVYNTMTPRVFLKYVLEVSPIRILHRYIVIDASDLTMTDSEWWTYLVDWCPFTLRVEGWNGDY